MSITTQCRCGATYSFELHTVYYEPDSDRETRAVRRRVLSVDQGYKQKARVHCECGLRIEILFKHSDGRR